MFMTTVQKLVKMFAVGCLLAAGTFGQPTNVAEPISALAVTADGKFLFAASSKNAASGKAASFTFVEASSGKRLMAGDDPKFGQISTSAFSGPTPFLAIANGVDIVRINLETNSFKTLIGEGTPVSSLVFGPDGKIFISGSSDDWLLWNIETGKIMKTLYHSLGLMTQQSIDAGKPELAAFSPAGDTAFLAYWSATKGVRIVQVDPKTGWTKGEPISLAEYAQAPLAMSPDGKSLIVQAANKVHAFDPVTGKKLYTIAIKDPVELRPRILFSRDGNIMLILLVDPAKSSFAGKMVVWDTVNQKKLAEIVPASKLGASPLAAITISPDGKLIYAARSGKIIRIDSATGKELGEW